MMGSLKALLCLGLLSADRADAHGAVTIPKPRNAVDGDQAPWGGKVPWPIPFGAPARLLSPRCCHHASPSEPTPSPQPLNERGRGARFSVVDEPNWCAHPSADMVGKDERNLTGSNGQACECIVQPVRKGMLPVA